MYDLKGDLARVLNQAARKDRYSKSMRDS